MACSPLGSFVHGILQENPGVGYHSNPGIKPVSPALSGWFFTTVPPGKPLEKSINTSKNVIKGKWKAAFEGSVCPCF